MDTRQLLEQIDLRAMAERAGARFNNSNRSRCPLHRGDNPTAFSVYRSQDGTWRWHCFTGCPEGVNSGDAISFYMRWREVDFKTAVNDLTQIAGITLPTPPTRVPTPSTLHPSAIAPVAQPPSQTWSKRAGEFVRYAQQQLWSAAGDDTLFYLHAERGLTDATLKRFGLGCNPRDIHDQPQRWGLADKDIWLPRGIVIPHFRNGQITFLNIRRPDRVASMPPPTCWTFPTWCTSPLDGIRLFVPNCLLRRCGMHLSRPME